tara:strand:- start:278 stop:448 length:171 start_codon:yes stop_codon:yes gene_type:complete
MVLPPIPLLGGVRGGFSTGAKDGFSWGVSPVIRWDLRKTARICSEVVLGLAIDTRK